MFPDFMEMEKMVTENGVNLMYNSVQERKLCCEIRKVHPLRKNVKGSRCLDNRVKTGADFY